MKTITFAAKVVSNQHILSLDEYGTSVLDNQSSLGFCY